MAESTAGHCAYCDNLLGRRPTIDHFLPKCDNPHLVYEWTNLYPCCDGCQEVKLDKSEPAALRPDEDGYEFSLYFRYDSEGRIRVIVDKKKNPVEWDRAMATIRLFKLDNRYLTTLRANALTAHPHAPQRWPQKPVDADSARGYINLRSDQTPCEYRPFRALYARD